MYTILLLTFELLHLFKTALALANHHELLSLSPSDHTVVRYTNESLIVQCHSGMPDVQLHWKSPKGEIIREHKGRIHIEQSSTGLYQHMCFIQCKILLWCFWHRPLAI